MNTSYQDLTQPLARRVIRPLFSVLFALTLLFGVLRIAGAMSTDLEPAPTGSRVAAVQTEPMLTTSSISATQADLETRNDLAWNLVRAMGVPTGTIVMPVNPEWGWKPNTDPLMGSDLRGFAVVTRSIEGFPTEGSNFAVLSTGYAADAILSNDSIDHTGVLSLSNNSQGNDLVRLNLKLKVPEDMNCASIDFAYFSEEFDEWVGHQYNDTFSAQLITDTYASEQLISDTITISGNMVRAPENFSFDTAGNIISVNTSFGVTKTIDSTYDGRTPPLRAQTAVVPGAYIDLYFTIQDLGDSTYDSAVFLDKFFWSKDPNCNEGATVDSDGDGLLDIWETQGLTVSVGGALEFVDLPAMGADPLHKDIFVEIDYMVDKQWDGIKHTHQPNLDAIAIVVAAFDAAPVTNPDGKTGIHLHVDYGKNAPLTYSSRAKTWGALSRSEALEHHEYFGSMAGEDYHWNEFDVEKSQHFTPGRAAVFHYNIWVHSMPETLNGRSGESRNSYTEFSSGASDFIVALGGWNWHEDVGTVNDQAGTFMHELGHNLGLQHGGADGLNYKPNYLSVMNYAFQFDGIALTDPTAITSSATTTGPAAITGSQQRFDYSRYELPTLDESSLHESAELITYTETYTEGIYLYGTKWFCPGKDGEPEMHVERDVSQSVDWDCDGVITRTATVTVAVNVNAGEVDSRDGTLTELAGQSDWDKLAYSGGAISQPGANVILPQTTAAKEITNEEAEQIPRFFPDIVTTTPQKEETWTLEGTIRGHTQAVEEVAWSPDGRRFASASDDSTVRVWNAVTLGELGTFGHHRYKVHTVAWSPNGRLLVSGSADSSIVAWDPGSGQVVWDNILGDDAILDVVWLSQDSILSGSADGAVTRWSNSGLNGRGLVGHTAAVNSVALSPDGTRLASASDDGTIKIWSVTTVKVLTTFKGHTDKVSDVAWSPDGTRLASSSFDKTIRIWDMAFDSQLTTLAGHQGPVLSVAWSPDGARLASGATDDTIRIWDVVSEETVATLEGADDILSVAWSPDGARLLSGSGDVETGEGTDTVQVWGR